jgi:hypothetical protein
VFVPISMTATRRSSCARSTASRECAEKTDFGFKLPSVAPNVQKMEEKYKAKKAA